MNIATEEDVKNVEKIRQRVKDGFYYSSTVFQIIAEKFLKEMKLKN